MSLLCEPIGLIRTPMQVRFDTPHQPDPRAVQENVVELFAGKGYELALSDLEGFDRIWLIWWFDRNTNWRPMVHTPRGDTRRRGVFATRSPHRPNPIGITAVPLIAIEGRFLTVGSCDLLDQTPILDIKPYINEVDSCRSEAQGWLDQVLAAGDAPARFNVTLSDFAQSQIDWLEVRWQVHLMTRVKEILERHPEPSRRFRITGARNGTHRLSSGGWRVYFSITHLTVNIDRIAPGFPRDLLLKEGKEVIPHYQAQLDFAERWPEQVS